MMLMSSSLTQRILMPPRTVREVEHFAISKLQQSKFHISTPAHPESTAGIVHDGRHQIFAAGLAVQLLITRAELVMSKSSGMKSDRRRRRAQHNVPLLRCGWCARDCSIFIPCVYVSLTQYLCVRNNGCISGCSTVTNNSRPVEINIYQPCFADYAPRISVCYTRRMDRPPVHHSHTNDPPPPGTGARHRSTPN